MKGVFGDRYKVIRKIGRGGMADVYKAEDTVLDRTVAIKVLHPQFAQEENFIARFRREAQAAAGLNHPSIVGIYDWGSEADTYFIVMEYLEGRDLKEIIQERGFLPPDIAIDIASQVCSALQFAHKHQIIHRDIKPHNIIITSEGEVKVTDFGIARAGTSTMTQTGSILGTAHYISPEQAQGAPTEIPSDIYSLGVVIYEMLTGKVPFEGDNPITVALRQVHEPPTPPRLINSAIPESLENVVLKALSKHPSDRYPSAQAMKDDLTRCAKGLPIKAVVTPSEEETVIIPSPFPPKKKERKNKQVFWVGLVAALLLAVLVAGWGVYALANTRVVPSVERKTLTEAKGILRERGLKLAVSGEEFHENLEAGLIISQEPKPNQKIAKDKAVKVVVSKGKESVELPDVVGMTAEQATYALAKAGFEIGELKRDFSDTIPENIVMGQEPEAGKKVTKGTVVNLLISKGQEIVQVPDVIGKTEQEATNILTQTGLQMSKSEEYSNEVEMGRVIRQSPQPGTEVERETRVNLVISLGAERVAMPDVRGKSEAEAKSILQGEPYNFTVAVLPALTGTPGSISDQYPAPETLIRRGSSVTIWVKQ